MESENTEQIDTEKMDTNSENLEVQQPLQLQDDQNVEQPEQQTSISTQTEEKVGGRRSQPRKTGNGNFRCSLCDKVFMSKCTLRQHELLHAGIPQYKCPLCPKMFVIPQYVYYHKVRAHNYKANREANPSGKTKGRPRRGAVKVTKLRVGPVTVPSRLSVDEVLKVDVLSAKRYQENIKPCTVQLNLVGPPETWKMAVAAATAQKRRPRPIQCHLCFKQFRFRMELHRHMLQFHNLRVNKEPAPAPAPSVPQPKKHFRCDHCIGKSFSCREYLNLHIKRKHPGIPLLLPLPRPSGKWSLGRKLSRKKHLLNKNKLRKVSCHKKNEVIRTVQKLPSNPSRSPPRTPPRIKGDHSRKNIPTPKSGLSAFICLFCAKEFKFYVHLESHMNGHFNENPYECNYCSKVFPYPSSLWLHEKKYHQGKQFECDICQATFHTKFHLKHHIEEEHGTVGEKRPAEKNQNSIRSSREDAEAIRTIFRHRLAYSLTRRSWRIRTGTGKPKFPVTSRILQLSRNNKKYNSFHGCDVCHRTFSTNTEVTRHVCVKKKQVIIEEDRPLHLWERLAEDLEKEQRRLYSQKMGGREVTKSEYKKWKRRGGADDESRLPSITILLNDADREFLRMICDIDIPIV